MNPPGSSHLEGCGGAKCFPGRFFSGKSGARPSLRLGPLFARLLPTAPQPPPFSPASPPLPRCRGAAPPGEQAGWKRPWPASPLRSSPRKAAGPKGPSPAGEGLPQGGFASTARPAASSEGKLPGLVTRCHGPRGEPLSLRRGKDKGPFLPSP